MEIQEGSGNPMNRCLSNMPQLIYGTAWKKEKTVDLVVTAVKCGFRGIDAACQPKHYNEAGVGEAIQRLAHEGITRQELFIQTKFTPVDGQDPLNIPYDKRASLSEQVAQSFEVSKKNLGINHLNGLILHSPLKNRDQTMIAWRAMEQLYHQGEVKRLGISNCDNLEMLKQLFQESSVKPSILQNRFYQQSHYDNEIRQWCQEQKVVYQSFWTLTANPHILSSQVIQQAARDYQKTAAQILFRALVDMGIVPLTGTSSDQHMKEDLEIFNFKFPATLIQEIKLLFSPF